MGGGVIDIEEDGVELTTWLLRIEALFWRSGKGKEIGFDETAPWISGEDGSEGNETATMPVDDGGKGVDDKKIGDALVHEGGDGGVAEAEASDDDIEGIAFGGGEAEIGEGFFDFMKEARHEEVFSEFDLEDFEVIEGGDASAAKDEVAEWGRLEVEFFVG
jgi:hypothetical protein